MTWQQALVSSDGTHHVLNGKPLYSERFNSVLAFHDPGFAPVERNGEAWHIHPDGAPSYSQRYNQTFGFCESLAAVVNNDGWHHIKINGTPLYIDRYSWCGNFQDGRCTVRNTDGTYTHITVDGEPAYTERWHYAGDFRNGVAVVQAEDGSSTHIDLNGNLIHDQWFLDLDVFHKCYARARDKKGWMHINLKGAPAYSQRFSMVEPFYNGQARVECIDGALEIIDEYGDKVLELRASVRNEY